PALVPGRRDLPRQAHHLRARKLRLRSDVVGGDARWRDRDLHHLRYAARLGDLEAVPDLRLRTARVHERQGLGDRAADDGSRKRPARVAPSRNDYESGPRDAALTRLRPGARACVAERPDGSVWRLTLGIASGQQRVWRLTRRIACR